jgi:ferredoxin--NADP+ reductase
MLGFEVEGRPLTRAYSMESANHEETLEFFSIKIPNGALTARLRYIEEGDAVLVGRKPTGTLVQDNLLPGSRLFLLSTGTGITPFLSIIKDPENYERFDQVGLAHGCRQVAELSYAETIIKCLSDNEFIGDTVRKKLRYYPSVTREPFRNRGRVTQMIAAGKMFDDLQLEPIDRATDRLMMCGSAPMLADLRHMLDTRGFTEGSHSGPGHHVIEKAFVER